MIKKNKIFRATHPKFLNPDETFERYEKRANSPLYQSASGNVGYNLVKQNPGKSLEEEFYKSQRPEVAKFVLINEDKKKCKLKIKREVKKIFSVPKMDSWNSNCSPNFRYSHIVFGCLVPGIGIYLIKNLLVIISQKLRK